MASLHPDEARGINNGGVLYLYTYVSLMDSLPQHCELIQLCLHMLI
jgi:hypothetical protein